MAPKAIGPSRRYPRMGPRRGTPVLAPVSGAAQWYPEQLFVGPTGKISDPISWMPPDRAERVAAGIKTSMTRGEPINE